MLRVDRLHRPLYPLVAGMAIFRQPRARKALRSGPSVTVLLFGSTELTPQWSPDLPVSAEPADSWRKQAWVLKNGVKGISFRLRVSPLSSLTSVKRWLPQWVFRLAEEAHPSLEILGGGCKEELLPNELQTT